MKQPRNKVLIIDDEQSSIDSITIALQSGGILDLVSSTDPTTALEKIVNCAPSIVLLDLTMPKKNGLEVAQEIISIVPNQRIIFASAFVENTLQESIKTLKKIVELMQKPFALQALVDTIEDKEIYRELEKLNVDITNLKELDPSHAQVRDYLDALKKIQKGRTF